MHKTGVLPDQQKLSYEGDELPADSTLEMQNIEDGAVLQLELHPPGIPIAVETISGETCHFRALLEQSIDNLKDSINDTSGKTL